MNVMQEFADYSTKFSPKLMSIREHLSIAIPNEETLFKEYGNKLLVAKLNVGTALADFNKYLDIATHEYMPERTKTTTDLERKALVEATVAPIRYFRDVCESTLETLDIKLEFMNSHYNFLKENNEL